MVLRFNAIGIANNEEEEEEKNKRQALDRQEKEFYHSIVDQALEHVQFGPLLKR